MITDNDFYHGSDVIKMEEYRLPVVLLIGGLVNITEHLTCRFQYPKTVPGTAPLLY